MMATARRRSTACPASVGGTSNNREFGFGDTHLGESHLEPERAVWLPWGLDELWLRQRRAERILKTWQRCKSTRVAPRQPWSHLFGHEGEPTRSAMVIVSPLDARWPSTSVSERGSSETVRAGR